MKHPVALPKELVEIIMERINSQLFHNVRNFIGLGKLVTFQLSKSFEIEGEETRDFDIQFNGDINTFINGSPNVKVLGPNWQCYVSLRITTDVLGQYHACQL